MLNQPGVSIVRDGQARAVVVTAARPSQVVAYAVDELVSHVEKATGRRLVLPIDIEPKVEFVLNGQQGKGDEERVTGFQYFPSHHRRDNGILTESIGSLEPQFVPE